MGSPIKQIRGINKRVEHCLYIKIQASVHNPEEQEEEFSQSSQWSLESCLPDDQCNEYSSSQGSVVDALSVLISPIEMITTLNPRGHSESELTNSLSQQPDQEDGSALDDEFNQAVFLNSQFVRNLSTREDCEYEDGPSSLVSDSSSLGSQRTSGNQRLSIVEILRLEDAK